MSLFQKTRLLSSRLLQSYRSLCTAPAGSSAEGAIGFLSGAPEKHLERKVLIYRPAKSAMQQGRGKTKVWNLKFEKLPGADRWTNPLMGWTSTGDPLSNTGLTFETKEAAIDFAKRNGYRYDVTEANEEKTQMKKISPFGRGMVHHWRHSGLPVYEGEGVKK